MFSHICTNVDVIPSHAGCCNFMLISSTSHSILQMQISETNVE